MGRPPIGKVAMTSAERVRRHRRRHGLDRPVTKPATKPSTDKPVTKPAGPDRAALMDRVALVNELVQSVDLLRELAAGFGELAAGFGELAARFRDFEARVFEVEQAIDDARRRKQSLQWRLRK
jgi:hypothetical protein